MKERKRERESKSETRERKRREFRQVGAARACHRRRRRRHRSFIAGAGTSNERVELVSFLWVDGRAMAFTGGLIQDMEELGKFKWIFKILALELL